MEGEIFGEEEMVAVVGEGEEMVVEVEAVAEAEMVVVEVGVVDEEEKDDDENEDGIFDGLPGAGYGLGNNEISRFTLSHRLKWGAMLRLHMVVRKKTLPCRLTGALTT